MSGWDEWYGLQHGDGCSCDGCDPATEQDFCDMHPDEGNGTHERLNFADECAYCGVRLAP
jgi:hypothetical protein